MSNDSPPAWRYQSVMPLPEPGWRCSAFYYAAHRGLPVTFGSVLELGLQAAGMTRLRGVRQVTVSPG